MGKFLDGISTESGKDCFKCPNCGINNELRAKVEVLVFACPNCFKIYSADEKNDIEYYRIDNRSNRLIPNIKLGKVGVINSQKYTVIGIAHKNLLRDSYIDWYEYVLLDITGKISFLIEVDYHYTLLAADNSINAAEYEKAKIEFVHDKRTYYYYDKYKSQTRNFVGEMNYDALDVETTTIKDFISPPKMISLEIDKNGKTSTFSGKDVGVKQIALAFGFPVPSFTVRKRSVGMTQVIMNGFDVARFTRNLLYLGFFLLVFWYAVHFFKDVKDDTHLFSKEIQINYKANDTSFVSPSFVIDDFRDKHFITYIVGSDINNEWLEYYITLVNENTGEQTGVSIPMEYYSGYEGGENWSEGSQTEDDGLSGVAPGRYHLQVRVAQAGIISSRQTSFEAKLSRPTKWNFIWILGIILGTVIIINLVKYNLENKRHN